MFNFLSSDKSQIRILIMKPLKSLIPIANWFLRISALAIVYSVGYVMSALTFSFNGLPYIASLSYSIVTVLLLIGGFQKNAKLTVISGLLLIILSLADLFFVKGFSVPNLINLTPLISIGIYFLAEGNE